MGADIYKYTKFNSSKVFDAENYKHDALYINTNKGNNKFVLFLLNGVMWYGQYRLSLKIC